MCYKDYLICSGSIGGVFGSRILELLLQCQVGVREAGEAICMAPLPLPSPGILGVKTV